MTWRICSNRLRCISSLARTTRSGDGDTQAATILWTAAARRGRSSGRREGGKPALRNDHIIPKEPAHGRIQNRPACGIKDWRDVLECIPRQKNLNSFYGSSIAFDRLAKRPE